MTGIAPPAGSKLASRLKDPAVKSKLNALAAYLKQGAKLCTDARTRERALAMLVHLQDIVSTRWFSSEQVQMIASLYPPDTELKLPVNPRVEILLALHSRTIDLWNYDNVLKMLPADERAELTFRLGVLNVWTPLKPDGPIMLDLTQMEERQVAKMLVHIMRSETGLSWKDETFQWDRFQHPIPGWDLNEAWYTESGMPAKGILALEFVSPPGRENWDLRINLSTLTLAGYPKEDQSMMAHIESGTTPSYTRANELASQRGLSWGYFQTADRAGKA